MLPAGRSARLQAARARAGSRNHWRAELQKMTSNSAFDHEHEEESSREMNTGSPSGDASAYSLLSYSLLFAFSHNVFPNRITNRTRNTSIKLYRYEVTTMALKKIQLGIVLEPITEKSPNPSFSQIIPAGLPGTPSVEKSLPGLLDRDATLDFQGANPLVDGGHQLVGLLHAVIP
jgi:hypothetical protein